VYPKDFTSLFFPRSFYFGRIFLDPSPPPLRQDNFFPFVEPLLNRSPLSVTSYFFCFSQGMPPLFIFFLRLAYWGRPKLYICLSGFKALSLPIEALLRFHAEFPRLRHVPRFAYGGLFFDGSPPLQFLQVLYALLACLSVIKVGVWISSPPHFGGAIFYNGSVLSPKLAVRPQPCLHSFFEFSCYRSRCNSMVIALFLSFCHRGSGSTILSFFLLQP